VGLPISDLLEADTLACPDRQKTGTLVRYDIQEGVEMQYLVLPHKSGETIKEWPIGVTEYPPFHPLQ